MVVAIIVSIVMVPMMEPVPPIFIGMTVVVVVTTTFVPIVERSVLLVSRINVNSEPIVCFGLARCGGNQPKHRQTQEEISFHI